MHIFQLAIEVDELGNNSRDIDYETERQKALEKELGCKFIRIIPAKENFNFLLKSVKYIVLLLNQLKN